jgi:hypothetical protein
MLDRIRNSFSWKALADISTLWWAVAALCAIGVWVVGHLSHLPLAVNIVLTLAAFALLCVVIVQGPPAWDKLMGREQVPLSDGDPRIIPDIRRGSFSNYTDYFVLTNHGKTDALDVQIQPLRLHFYKVTFPLIPHIASGKDSKFVASVMDDAGLLARSAASNDFASALESDAELHQKNRGRGKTFIFKGSVKYRDYQDHRFATEFTLTHKYPRELIEFGSFKFYRLKKGP